jgi:hypothetical protein
METPLIIRMTLALIVLSITPASAQAPMRTGNDYEAACRLFVAYGSPSEPSNPKPLEHAKMGQCVGALMATAYLGTSLAPLIRFCVPESATLFQVAKVVLKYMDDHPSKLDQEFPRLAAQALRLAWPCSASAN